MLETTAAIVSIVATLVGAGKGFVDLYQAAKSISSPPEQNVIKYMKDRQSKFAFVYENLEVSGKYVAKLLKRMQTHYIVIAMALTVAWLLVLLIALSVASHADTMAMSVGMVVVGGLAFLFFAMQPSQIVQISLTNAKLKESYYLALINRIGGTMGDGPHPTTSVLADTVPNLEHKLNKAISAISQITRSYDFYPNKYFSELLPIQPLTTAERDLLDAHIQLSSLVASIEAQLLKTRLLEAKSLIQDLARQEIRSILLEATRRLVRDEVLVEKPTNEEAWKEWQTQQAAIFKREFDKLGAGDWQVLIPSGSPFYARDFAKLVHQDDSRDLEIVFEQFLGLSRKTTNKR